MDVTAIARLSTSIAETGTKQAVGIGVLKKALEVETSTAAALIQALPPVPSVQPANLGNTIDTTA